MKKRYREVLSHLQNLIKDRDPEIVIAPHVWVSKTLATKGITTTANALSNRYAKNGYLNEDELRAIQSNTGIELLEKEPRKLIGDCVEIEHVHINPSCGSGACVYDVADITPVKLGKEIIRDILKIKDPKQLKLFIANGDSMEPIIENGDTLLIDTGNIEYSNGGVFLITINENWFIKRLRMKLSGELEVISDNLKYPIETIARNEDIEVKIKGRVIKNLSRGL